MFTFSESLANLAPALAQFQAEVKNPANTAVNPQFRSKYAPLDVVLNTVKPILSKYDLSVIQSTGAVGESVVITTMLLHKSGEWIQTAELPLPAYQTKSGGVKEFNAQGAGSAITYGRRYQLSAILGLSSEDDDDANGQVFGGSSNGYKDASNNTNTKKESEEERKRKREEALAKAQAKKEAKTSTQESQPEPEAKPEDTTIDPNETVENVSNDSEEKINAGQIKAIMNLLTVVERKKKDAFNKDVFITAVLTDYGVTDLEDISSEQAKEVIAKVNAEMRS